MTCVRPTSHANDAGQLWQLRLILRRSTDYRGLLKGAESTPFSRTIRGSLHPAMKPLVLSLTSCLALATPVLGQAFEKAEFKASSGDTLRYAMLKPSETTPGQRYPLVITLHGVGGRGKEDWEGGCAANKVLASPDMRKKYPCFVVAPTCGKEETWRSAGRLRGKERLPDVFELIESLLKEQPIDPDCIYITGQSMGGFGTFDAIVRHPDLFAAAVPVCGGHDPSEAKKIAHLPIWVFHGAKDRTVPVEMSRKMVEAIKEAGGKPKYTEYPEAGHNSWTAAYGEEEMWAWLFGQRRGLK